MADGRLKAPEFAPPSDEDPEVARQVTLTRQKTGNVGQPEDRVTSRAAPATFLLDDDMLQVTNDGRTTLDFRWAGKHYVLEPGETKFVILQALVNQLGDPRSADDTVTRYDDGAGNRGVIPKRYDELVRLFAMYGVTNERIEDGPTTGDDDDGRGLVTKIPKVRAWTLGGVPVQFPGARPDMMAMAVPMVDSKAVNSDMVRWASAIEAENADLRRTVERTNEMVQQLLDEREGKTPAGE